MTSVLSIQNYALDYITSVGPVRVLHDISLEIRPGEVLGLVGESGSGKSSLAWALMRHLPDNAREVAGSLRLGDIDLQRLSPRELTKMRGCRLGMVFQDPSTSLNPTLTIGRQITEALIQHRGLKPRDADALAIDLLGHVDLNYPAAIMRRYPHEISGGEKQRVIIATAFGCRPDVILFDEPTTALDVITGARILELFARLRRETGVAALYISHDLALVTRVADRVAVLERGRLVELAPAADIFRAPRHANTRALVDAVPRPERRLVHDKPRDQVLLAASDIEVQYGSGGLFRDAPPPATKKIGLEVRGGEILGLVGESGSGKSSMARALTGLARFSGKISFDEHEIHGMHDMNAAYRRDVQIIFQHPDSSLNPRHRIDEILSRPLKLYGGHLADISGLLDQVRLPASYANRWPHQLSGGEKQRIAIARAFAARPKLVICDEITAPLDVSVQAQIVELLLALREETGTAFLFITHDLNLIRQIAHRIAVMRRGEVVDLLPVEDFDADHVHPYTRELMAASPVPVGRRQGFPSMDHNAKALLDGIDAHAALDLLSRMVQHKSYSRSDGEKQLAAFMAGRMREIGLETELAAFGGEGRVNAVGRWTGSGGGKSLMFNGHLDTNPVTEGWTVDPWAGKVDDAFIYGIGVSNMKAGDAAYFCAVKTLIDAGVKLKGDVILTYVVGELQGGVGTYSLVEQGLRADYFINSEPTDLKAMTMHAAAFMFIIELTGNTRHLSKREEAVDAITAACDLIPRLNATKFSGALSPEHERINRVHVGVVHGALGRELHEWRTPQVADFVRIKGSGRYAPGQSEAGALADMRRELDALEARFPGLKAEIMSEDRSGVPTMPPFEVARTSPIVEAVNRAYRAVRGKEQPTGAVAPSCFYGTDAGHLHYFGGMEGIVCGPGGRYNTMPDERVDISDFIDMIRIYMLAILDICA